MRNKLGILGFLIWGLISSLGAQDSGKDQRISWEKVQGAGSYQVTVQTEEKKTVYQETTQETSVKVKLPVGKYRFMVQVFNRFSKPLGATPWTSLEIKRTFSPDILTYEPQVLYQNTPKAVVTIQGQGFLQESRITLEKDEEKIPGEILEIDKTWVMKVAFDLQGKSPGKYALIIENPLSLTFQKAEGLEIKPNLPPVFLRMDAGNLEAGKIYKSLEVQGRQFEPGMTFWWELGDKKILPLMVEESSLQSRSFLMDLSDVSGGEYTLVMQNPGGAQIKVPGVLKLQKANPGDVSKPPLGPGPQITGTPGPDIPRIGPRFRIPGKAGQEKPFKLGLLPLTLAEKPRVPENPNKPEITPQNPGKITEDRPRISYQRRPPPTERRYQEPPYQGPLNLPVRGAPNPESLPFKAAEPVPEAPPLPPNGNFSLVLGYSPLLLTSGLSQYFKPSFLGGALEIHMDIDNRHLRGIPVLDGLGLGGEGAFWLLEGTDGSYKNLKMTLLHTGVLMYYAPRWDWFLDLQLSAGGGVSFSWVSNQTGTTNTSSNSSDFYVRAGGRIGVKLGNFLFHLGSDFRRTFLFNRTTDGFSGFGGLGLRF